MKPNTNAGLALGAALAVVAAGVVYKSIQIIPAGERGVLMHFGAPDMVPLAPGLHFTNPFTTTVAWMNVQVQKAQGIEAAASKDLQDVTTTVAVNWHIVPASAPKVFQNVGGVPSIEDKLIQPAISNAVKAVTASYNAEDIIAHRDELAGKMATQLNAALLNYDVVIDGVNVVNIKFSDAFNNAIEAKQVAQQKAQQAEYDLQRAQVNAKQKVVEAQAQSDAQKLLQLTITPEIIAQQAIAKWDGHLPTYVTLGPGGVVPTLPVK